MDTCVICGHESDGYHFGVQACRACSSFFRRCIAERKAYKCRKANNCVIRHDDRVICRACRFRLCKEAGMKSELVRNGPKVLEKPSNRQVEMQSPQNSHIFMPTSSVMQIPMNESFESSISYPLLNKLLHGVRNYMSSQRSLFTVENPDKIFAEHQFQSIKKSQYDRIEKCCITLINSMLTEFFDPYESMRNDEKGLIIQQFYLKFTNLIRCYQTAKIYPENINNRIVIIYGYYMDETNLEYFFEEIKNWENIINICRPILAAIREIASKMIKYDVRDIDIAALSYLMFAQECEKSSLCKDMIELNKNLLFHEMHNNFVQSFGFELGGIKFATSLCLLNDLVEIHNRVWESYTIGKIFMPEWTNVWDELC